MPGSGSRSKPKKRGRDDETEAKTASSPRSGNDGDGDGDGNSRHLERKHEGKHKSERKRKRKRGNENENELPAEEATATITITATATTRTTVNEQHKPDGEPKPHLAKKKKKTKKARKGKESEEEQRHRSSPREGNSNGHDNDTGDVADSAVAAATTDTETAAFSPHQLGERGPEPSPAKKQKTKKASKHKHKRKRARKQPHPLAANDGDGDGDGDETVDANDTDDNHANDDEVVLEGSMVSDVFVLIDRKGGRVYSAFDQRLENGERKQVGRLDENGRVILFSNNNDNNNNSNNNKETKKDDPPVGETHGDPSSDFPYEVDPDDHCESPLEAYEDIVSLLQSYKRWIRKDDSDKRQLSIYDPYFCNGRVARQLASLGFPEVYNRKENCYEVWNDPSKYPAYDVFLTNPPYSADHIETLMRHVTSKKNHNKPWMLLMPNFVHKKDYFQKLTADADQLPIYLVPKKRYIYLPPPAMREKKASSTHKKSSPFVSMWYLWGGTREVTNEWYRVLLQNQQQQSGKFDVARSKSALRDLRRKPKKRK